MTINKAIEHGTNQLEIFGGRHKEFIKCAIDTMRKYQKIEQALNSWNMNCINDKEFINTIREVIDND